VCHGNIGMHTKVRYLPRESVQPEEWMVHVLLHILSSIAWSPLINIKVLSCLLKNEIFLVRHVSIFSNTNFWEKVFILE